MLTKGFLNQSASFLEQETNEPLVACAIVARKTTASLKLIFCSEFCQICIVIVTTLSLSAEFTIALYEYSTPNFSSQCQCNAKQKGDENNENHHIGDPVLPDNYDNQ